MGSWHKIKGSIGPIFLGVMESLGGTKGNQGTRSSRFERLQEVDARCFSCWSILVGESSPQKRERRALLGDLGKGEKGKLHWKKLREARTNEASWKRKTKGKGIGSVPKEPNQSNFGTLSPH